ncbi:MULTISPECIES: hypothetical protein [unclassified Streptomyces]|uniref:hypothetical protein n=1 Tax=unclassified Streptomyces TaxID=2593676 RepID=UPI003D72F62A
MKFVQIVDFRTERLEEINELLQEFALRHAGRPNAPAHHMLLKDRDNSHRYLAVIEFDSHEEAMRNSDDPETSELAEQLGALCIGDRVYTNCDVLDPDAAR